MEKLKIRAYHPGDKPELIKLIKLNVPEYFDESEIDDLDDYLEHKVEQYFVAEYENTIVGAGGINFDDNYKTGKISWDFIDPQFQGRGIGQKLLKHRLDLMQSIKSIDNIKVRTSQLAYKFYEKNGFVLRNIIKDYWAKGFDLYDMTYEYTHADF